MNLEHLLLLFVLYSLFLSDLKTLPNFWNCFSATVVWLFSFFSNGKYSNFLIAVAFSNKSFSGTTSLPVKNSYSLTLPDDKAEILVICLSKSYWDLFWSILLSIALIFSLNTHFYSKFFLNRNGLSDDQVVSLTKNEYDYLI